MTMTTLGEDDGAIGANGGAVIEPAYPLHAGQYCSISKITTLPGHDNWNGPAADGSKKEAAPKPPFQLPIVCLANSFNLR
jgi:hypothetical protein